MRPKEQTMTEPLRIWWNKNLHGKISAGKLAAHAAHAALRAYGIEYDHPIVVLAAGKGRIEAMPINVHDEGRTELAPGTLTTGVDDTSHQEWLTQTGTAALDGAAAEIEACISNPSLWFEDDVSEDTVQGLQRALDIVRTRSRIRQEGRL